MSSRPIRFGLGLLGRNPVHEMAEQARQAEQAGVDVVLLPDHLGMTSPLVPLVTMAEAAPSIRVGTLVLNCGFYRPALLARDLAAVDSAKVALSPRGDVLASASQDKTLRIWDLKSRQLIAGPLTAHVGSVVDVAFDHSGDRIVSASQDGTARVWDAHTGNPIGQPLAGHSGPLTAAEFLKDDRHVVTGSEDGTARIWNLDFDGWVEAGCRVVGRNLTLDEWQRYLGQRPYERTCPDFPAGTGAQIDAPATQY